MKNILLALLVLLSSASANAQQTDKYTYANLTVNGVPFYTSRPAILKAFGKPVKEFKPNYECGFLSANEQGEVFYTLQYNAIKWTGNKKSKYVMEELLIKKGSKFIILFKGKVLSNYTSLAAFIKISHVGQDAIHQIIPTNNQNHDITYVDLYQNSDDKFIFYFLNDKLYRIEYWSPC